MSGPRGFLGVDVGTTGVRAGAVDEHGRVLAEASESWRHDAPRAGWAEADPDAWWAAVARACRSVVERVGADRIEAVAVVGQAPTAVLVDASCRPLRPAILWLDVRASEEAHALDAALGPGRAEAIGGNRMHPYFVGPKLAWLRAHEPQALDQAALVLQSHAFVAMRLTGKAACDASTAMLCAPLFDPRSGSWSEEAARAAGVPVRLLPPLARAQDVLGGVTGDASTATGLREGTPVVAGGGDFAACALGAGVVEEGDACLMLGTAGNLLLPVREPRFDARLLNSHHVGCDRWLTLAGTLCGAALEWFRGAFAPGIPWETLESEAAAVPVGADGVVALPYLQGERTPIWDERARGVFAGLSLRHGRGHLYRALLESIALSFRHSLSVTEAAGLRLREVVATNGAGKSALLRQTLADALGTPLVWSPQSGGTLAGAAVLAGLGTSAIGDAAIGRRWLHDAGALRFGGGAPNQQLMRHVPDPGSHARLEEVFARRQALFAAEIAARGLPR
ncbi:MAG TPA: FGGY family carbohydrate kinase [Polyangiaceae bacterium]